MILTVEAALKTGRGASKKAFHAERGTRINIVGAMRWGITFAKRNAISPIASPVCYLALRLYDFSSRASSWYGGNVVIAEIKAGGVDGKRAAVMDALKWIPACAGMTGKHLDTCAPNSEKQKRSETRTQQSGTST